ncbi:GGDEF domain-containing protein [Rhizobium sp. SGZ-381]|uniref:GGDEF domain-containing protein n=1 Tax=Rhizobium sp. SGZ-381 TaxID=3342800 RepID=UPI00366E6773
MDLSPISKARVNVGTAIGTSICIVVAIAVDSLSFSGMSPDQIRTSLRNDILIPLLLGGFFFHLLLSKMRALAIAQQELQRIASTDSLTSVLNRGAFTMLVEAYLDEARRGRASPEGALLLVDVDHFKTINDTFGHPAGDEALRRIATSIRDAVGQTDLVGRVGGEEFGVFLLGAAQQARATAEKIRLGVNGRHPGAVPEQLSVSVGGVTFNGLFAFGNLLAAADRYLYDAKAAGRNCVVVGSATPLPADRRAATGQSVHPPASQSR